MGSEENLRQSFSEPGTNPSEEGIEPEDRWARYVGSSHAPAPCTKCGEIMILALSRDRACAMTPRCDGRHVAPKKGRGKRK